MLSEAWMKLALAVVVPVSGAVGYLHLNFASIGRVIKIEKKVNRVDNLMCLMAIREKLDSAEKICTDKE